MLRWETVDLSTSSSADVEAFLERSSPTKLSEEDGVAWIAAHFSQTPQREQDEGHVDTRAMLATFSAMASSGQVTKDAVLQLGAQHGLLCAKWLFFLTHSDLDSGHVWDDLVRSMHKGKVTSSTAKVSSKKTASSSVIHVVCVFTEDFRDTEAVLRLEKELRACGILKAMHFKPDVYTALGVYKNNPWGLNPCLYTSRWNAAQMRSVIS